MQNDIPGFSEVKVSGNCPCGCETAWFYCNEPMLDHCNALPCPKCKSKDLEFCANVVICCECEYRGPSQKGAEYMCDWRWAIQDWNNTWVENLSKI